MQVSGEPFSEGGMGANEAGQLWEECDLEDEDPNSSVKDSDDDGLYADMPDLLGSTRFQSRKEEVRISAF
jgi:hypothetical protein